MSFDLNHAGFVLFDEPRQQSAGRAGFKHLLARVAAGKELGRQVIFATSEPLASMLELVEGLDVQMLHFDERVVKPRP